MAMARRKPQKKILILHGLEDSCERNSVVLRGQCGCKDTKGRIFAVGFLKMRAAFSTSLSGGRFTHSKNQRLNDFGSTSSDCRITARVFPRRDLCIHLMRQSTTFRHSLHFDL